MKVYVIMGNDFPESVFKDEAEANKYVEEKKLTQSKGRPGIYWRVWEFELK